MKTWQQLIGKDNRSCYAGINETIFKQIQADALRHAAQLVHDMSRGTKSKERAIAIDEARDIIMDEIKIVAAED